MQSTDNLRIKELRPLISPEKVLAELPLSNTAEKTIINGRNQLNNILQGHDHRLAVIIGPCSIHDVDAALDYATRLQPFITQYSEHLCIIMRVYFEKPRTIIGWKGLINDPDLNNSFDINKGLYLARKLLLEINNLGIPTGSEFLDTTIPQYISDLTSWAAIGARTTESQIHRELASGLSMPVGFKNATCGDIQVAIDAVQAATHSHHFLGITKAGIAAIINTTGNQSCHIILRGSNKGPNYDLPTIHHTINLLQNHALIPRIMIDCSHGNSNKQPLQQLQVIKDVAHYLQEGTKSIFGVMIESNIVGGNQKLIPGQALTYGQSITDACINWENTVEILEFLHDTMVTIYKKESSND